MWGEYADVTGLIQKFDYTPALTPSHAAFSIVMTPLRARLARGIRWGGGGGVGGVHAGLASNFFVEGVTVSMHGQLTTVYDFRRCTALEKLSVC